MTGFDPVQASFMAAAVARVTLAIILALSAVDALRDLAMHATIVEQYRLLPRWLVRPAAVALPGLSLLAAITLPPPATCLAGAVLALVLLAVFTAAIAINLWRGNVAIECGCGGAGGQHLSPALLGRNMILMAGAVFVAIAPAQGSIDIAAIAGIVGASAGLTVLYFAANQILSNFQAFGTPAEGN